jgi:hypothetical protein
MKMRGEEKVLKEEEKQCSLQNNGIQSEGENNDFWRQMTHSMSGKAISTDLADI